jgi:hypothetical protein
LRREESVKLRAQALNESCGGGEITLLISDHQRFQFAVGVHKRKAAHPIITIIGLCWPPFTICNCSPA